MLAAKMGHIEIVNLLLTHKDIDVKAKNTSQETAFMLAKNAKIAKDLLAYAETHMSQTNTPQEILAVAAKNNIPDLFARYFFEEALNKKDASGETLLMVAARAGNSRIVKSLLQHDKIDLNILMSM